MPPPCVAKQRADLRGVEGRAPADADEPVPTARRGRLDRLSDRRLGRLARDAVEDARSRSPRRAARPAARAAHARGGDERVADDERPRHAEPAQVPARLGRAARAEHEWGSPTRTSLSRLTAPAPPRSARPRGRGARSARRTPSGGRARSRRRAVLALTRSRSRAPTARRRTATWSGRGDREAGRRRLARRARSGRLAVLRVVRHEQRLARRRPLAIACISSTERGASGKSTSAPGLGVRGEAVDRVVEPVDGDRIGAGDDHRVGIGARGERGPHFAHHLVARDHLLALHMTAALGEGLILELDRGGARALVARARCG